ncbi:MarR family transcriptional regulator [Sulfolobus sp. E5-1-F]|uniref:MarR family transcriptional regulator n=1 Tax=Sulfolobaceae TaxID=118883 RepID=UPI001295E1BF|nr:MULTISPECIES: MarR family winged helix-turn-helix transcriptional regulator [unclassified Sulfolobus]QGA53303.1 MarR family transcriptional regulator [Sulfolobus sp. E5-1-F]QGA68418.1 MarR family transcriptional regulator [Sulfolobus sp. E11-6]
MNLREKILAYLYQNRECTLEEIAEGLKEDKYEVDATLKYLERDGLVIKKTKGIIFKKTVYDLTASGFEEAKKIYESLQEKSRQLQELIVSGKVDPSQLPLEYVDILPLLVTLSLLDMMLLEDLTLFDAFGY